MKIDITNWKKYLSEMRKIEGRGKCWQCNADIEEIYHYDTKVFENCKHCGKETCIDFSGLMPLFGVPLADEWKAEEKARQRLIK